MVSSPLPSLHCYVHQTHNTQPPKYYFSVALLVTCTLCMYVCIILVCHVCLYVLFCCLTRCGKVRVNPVVQDAFFISSLFVKLSNCNCLDFEEPLHKIITACTKQEVHDSQFKLTTHNSTSPPHTHTTQTNPHPTSLQAQPAPSTHAHRSNKSAERSRQFHQTEFISQPFKINSISSSIISSAHLFVV